MAQTVRKRSAVHDLTITKQSRHVLVRAYSFLFPYWRIALAAYVAAIASNILAVIVPQFIRWTVDVGIVQQETNMLTWGVLAMLGLTFVKGVLDFLVGRWSEVASQNVAYDIRNAIHQKLAALSFSYHDQAESGQLLSRAIQDVERIRFLAGRAVLRMFQSLTLLLITIVALVAINPRLTALAMMTMPALLYVGFRFGKVMRPLSRDIQDQLAVLTTVLEQNLRGARIVKAFAQEEAEVAKFDDANGDWFKLSTIAIKSRAVNVPLMDFIASLSTVIIIWYGGRLVIQEALTVGELVAFITYLGQLVNPIRRFGIIIPAIAMAAASGERIFEILDAKSEVEEAPDAVELPTLEGHVRF